MKKIYSLLLLGGLLLLGVNNAWARRIYLNYDALTWYHDASSATIHAWGGSSEQDVAMIWITGNNVYADINDDQTSICFYRHYYSNNVEKKEAWTENATISNDKNYYFLSSSQTDGKYQISASAYVTQSACVIFDNHNANWTNVTFWIGHNSYTSCYPAENISNTKLYYSTLSSYYNYSQYRFVNDNTTESGSFNMGDGSHNPTGGYSAVKSNDWLSENSNNLFTFNGTTGASLSKTALSAVSDLNRTQTLSQAYNNGSSYVAPSVSLATVAVSGYVFSDSYTSVGAIGSPNGFTVGTAYSAAVTNAAAYTSTVTISVSNVLTGFQFDGFYNSTTSKAVSHTTTDGVHTCTYSADQANTIVARFSPVDYTYTANSSGWGTLCLPYNVAADDHSGVTFYSILGVDNISNPSVMYLGEEKEELSAGCPYIVHATSSSTITAGTSMAAAGSSNGLIGTYVRTEVANGYYVIYDGKVQKVNVSGSGKVVCGANRAYINMAAIDDSYTPVPSRPFVLMPLASETTTAIGNVEASEKAVKFFENGQMYILRNGVTYDMTGRAVK